MQVIIEELTRGLDDGLQLTRIIIRLVAAICLGAVFGFERQREGKTAGMRTYMLVALGSALFTLVPSLAAMSSSDLGRVIQGVATGIGFLGAGTILKMNDEHRIEGLTSAAGIWVTAAMGMAVGIGWLGPALLTTLLGWFILEWMYQVEKMLKVRPAEMVKRKSDKKETS